MLRAALLAVLLAFTFSSAHAADVAPTIASVSPSATVTEGTALTLSVSVNGTTPFTYQWRKEGVPISGATSNKLTLDPIRVGDSGSYTVAVTNVAGSVTGGPILIAVTPATPPSFYHAKGTVAVTLGNSFSMYAYTRGSHPMTFTWTKDGVVIPGAINESYSKEFATLADAGVYRVTATNIAGTATGNAITVVVSEPTPPAFTDPPDDVSGYPGESVEIYFGATGTEPMTYELIRDGAVISTSTWRRLSLDDLNEDKVGDYTVRATNSAGSVSSPSFRISMLPARLPEISVYSSEYRVIASDTVTLQPTVWYGTPPLTYQWHKDRVPIEGATQSSLVLSNVTLSDVGNYTVTVSNVAGSVRSNPMNVAVRLPRAPVITQHPASTMFSPGDWVILNVGTSGENLRFQWTKDGAPIANANGASLTVATSFAASDAGTYRVTVSNDLGSVTSEPATISVRPARAPVIRAHPQSQTRYPGESLNLSVEVTAQPTPTYQWKKDGVAIASANSQSLYLPNLAASDAGDYTVTVTNSEGSVTSEAAVIDVDPLVAPVILRHPSSTSLLPGGYGSIDVQLLNPHGVTYQWKKDNEVLAGVTSSSYSFSSAGPAHAGKYTVTVSNAAGSVTSEAAEVRVDTTLTRPLIIRSSGSIAARPGNWVAFDIGTSADSANVQWYLDGVLIPSATSSYLSFTASEATAGLYTAIVTADGRKETSKGIRMSVLADAAPPRISHHPRAITADVGGEAQFFVDVEDSNQVTYQWRRNGANIPLAQQHTLRLSDLTISSTGTYTVVVSNSFGSTTSHGAKLTIRSAELPRILQQPRSMRLTSDGYSSQLSVHAEGSGQLQYQWYRNGKAISGATGYYYYLYLNNDATGDYHVVVSNSAGSVTSTNARVTQGGDSTGPRFTTAPTNEVAYIGSSVTIRSAASGTGALTYQWRKNGVDISGATQASLTLPSVRSSDAGEYAVWATDTSGSTASRTVQLTVQAPLPPVIVSQPVDTAVFIGSVLRLHATITATPQATLQWYRNGQAVAGATGASLSLTNFTSAMAGSYHLVATNAGGTARSRTVLVSVASPYSGVYFGTFTTGSGTVGRWGMQVIGQSGRFIGVLNDRSLAIVRNVSLLADGSFTLDDLETSNSGMKATRDRYFAGPVSGRIAAGGSIQGTITDLGVAFTGTEERNTGSASWTGTYEGVLLYSAAGTAHVIVSPDRRVVVVLVQADMVLGGIGTLLTDGSFDVAIGNQRLMGRLDRSSHSATGSLQLASGQTLNFARPSAANGPERLVNLSIRATAGSGSRTLIVGFVVGGLIDKSVLVRGAGPALSNYKIVDFLADPRLRLHIGDTVISENDDWDAGGLGPMIASVSEQAGAFAFRPASRDAALLQELAPGGYTAHVAGPDGATGVALVEVYEEQGGNGEPRLLNVSARSEVGRGDAIMIVGLIVRGDAPKRFLVRGVGPTLKDFKVTGYLENPYLRLFRDQTLVRENDDWSAGPDAGDIAAVAAPVGAFALPDGSKDAALLVYLEPGRYSAQLSGVGDTTGVGLIEVYEVP